MAQDKPNIRYGPSVDRWPNISPHDSTPAQHGPNLEQHLGKVGPSKFSFEPCPWARSPNDRIRHVAMRKVRKYYMCSYTGKQPSGNQACRNSPSVGYLLANSPRQVENCWLLELRVAHVLLSPPIGDGTITY